MQMHGLMAAGVQHGQRLRTRLNWMALATGVQISAKAGLQRAMAILIRESHAKPVGNNDGARLFGTNRRDVKTITVSQEREEWLVQSRERAWFDARFLSTAWLSCNRALLRLLLLRVEAPPSLGLLSNASSQTCRVEQGGFQFVMRRLNLAMEKSKWSMARSTSVFKVGVTQRAYRTAFARITGCTSPWWVVQSWRPTTAQPAK
jgi:hypothetical protein